LVLITYVMYFCNIFVTTNKGNNLKHIKNTNIMSAQKFQIGQEVVRAKGDYVVGRIGTIIDIDIEKQRANVKWNEDPKSWISFSALELTSIPYEIIPAYQKDRFTWVRPKYRRL
jgi:hypothetical protein